MRANPEHEPSTDVPTAAGSNAERKDVDPGGRKPRSERDVVDVNRQVDREDRPTGGRTWREPFR